MLNQQHLEEFSQRFKGLCNEEKIKLRNSKKGQILKYKKFNKLLIISMKWESNSLEKNKQGNFNRKEIE